jgi:hypothetical protein
VKDKARLAAVFAAYLYEGFFYAAPKGDKTFPNREMTDDESDSVGGNIGAVNGLVDIADGLAKVMLKLDEGGIEYPGVFEYEVVEEIGSLYRLLWQRRNVVPLMRLAAAEEITQFFFQTPGASQGTILGMTKDQFRAYIVDSLEARCVFTGPA